MVLLAGCGSKDADEVTLADYLEEVEFDAPLEKVRNVHLGDYLIPIAAQVQRENAEAVAPVWMKLRFTLFAETTPEHEALVEEAFERQRGAIQDAILEICRSTSVDEVLDPRLAAVKSRLSDAAKSLLGKEHVRALVLGQIQTDFL